MTGGRTSAWRPRTDEEYKQQLQDAPNARLDARLRQSLTDARLRQSLTDEEYKLLTARSMATGQYPQHYTDEDNKRLLRLQWQRLQRERLEREEKERDERASKGCGIAFLLFTVGFIIWWWLVFF